MSTHNIRFYIYHRFPSLSVPLLLKTRCLIYLSKLQILIISRLVFAPVYIKFTLVGSELFLITFGCGQKTSTTFQYLVVS